MAKNDRGLNELLALLKAHPELIKELVFDQPQIRKLLRGRSARRLLRGGDTTVFLEYMAGPEGGYPVAQCFGLTQAICAKGTQVVLGCVRGTGPV